MNYGYIRISTDKQTTENQRFEIQNFTDKKQIFIDEWIDETISSTKKLDVRKFGGLLQRMQKGDVIIVSELSRLDRNLMQIMKILHDCMEKDVMVYTIKENYELGNNINSKVLAFAFGLSAEIERNLIFKEQKKLWREEKQKVKYSVAPKGVNHKCASLLARRTTLSH